MADNRIYIKCECCGAQLFLGKRLGLNFYWENYGKWNNEEYGDREGYVKQDESSLEDRLNRFFYDHAFCEHAEFDFPTDRFSIAYEDDEEYKALMKSKAVWENI